MRGIQMNTLAIFIGYVFLVFGGLTGLAFFGAWAFGKLVSTAHVYPFLCEFAFWRVARGKNANRLYRDEVQRVRDAHMDSVKEKARSDLWCPVCSRYVTFEDEGGDGE